MIITRLAVAIFIISALLALLFSEPIPTLVKIEKGDVKKQEDIPNLLPYPINKENFQKAPEISAHSAVVIDAKTGVTLYEKEPNLRLLPASTTKLLTAIVTLEKCTPEKLVTVAYVETEPNVMGLAGGDVVSVKTLLYGLLMFSANDAAYVLSYSCAPNTEEFVKEMNLKAKELDLKSTHFSNPAGFDSEDQFTTARDLAKLSKVAIANPLISKIVATRQTVLTDAYNLKTYYLLNINKLLGEVEGVEGIKTGQTQGSLEVLVSQTTRGGNTIVAVILASQDRFLDSKQLIEWAFANHQWVNP